MTGSDCCSKCLKTLWKALLFPTESLFQPAVSDGEQLYCYQAAGYQTPLTKTFYLTQHRSLWLSGIRWILCNCVTLLFQTTIRWWLVSMMPQSEPALSYNTITKLILHMGGCVSSAHRFSSPTFLSCRTKCKCPKFLSITPAAVPSRMFFIANY